MAQISHAVESPSHLRTKMGGLSKASDRRRDLMRNPVSKTPGRSRRSVGAQFLKSISWAQRYFHWKLLAFVDFQAGANNCQSISKTEICCWPDSTASGSKKMDSFQIILKMSGNQRKPGGGAKVKPWGPSITPCRATCVPGPFCTAFASFSLVMKGALKTCKKALHKQ